MVNSLRRFDLWGAPFDGGATLGWPGSRYAPDAIRRNLAWMWMRVEDGQIYSIEEARFRNVSPDLVEDRGDVDVVPHDLAASLRACSEAVTYSVRNERVPIVVGGDDSLLFACVRGFHDAVAGSVAVLHFDAHFDLMSENRNQGRFSHSSGMRRSLELQRVSVANSMQVGVRLFGFPSSRVYAGEAGLTQLTAQEFGELGTQAAVERVLGCIAGADHVFWSFDIDCIDPSHAPGAGAHEPAGLTSRQALDCIRLLAARCDGFAVTEVNPMKDTGGMTATLAAYLVFGFVVFGSEPP